MDGGAWRATVQGVTEESDTTERLNNGELLVAVLDGVLLQHPRGLPEVLPNCL